LQYVFNESRHHLEENVRFNWDTNCFVYLQHSLRVYDDQLLFSLVLFYTCFITLLLIDNNSCNHWVEREREDCTTEIVWFVIRSFAIDCELELLTEKWSISRRILFLNFFIVSFELIYCHTLIFRAKSLSSSIQR
jgi:hypothetical protein